MAIPASDLVRIQPRVLTGTGSDLAFNGLLLTDNAFLPPGTVQPFYSAAAVLDYFGEASDEYKAAQVYFNGFNNSTSKPGCLLMYRSNQAASAGFVRGARLTDQAAALAAVKAISSGTLDAVIGSETVNLTAVDLSSAGSLSDACATLQTAIRAAGSDTAVTAATVSFSSVTGAVTITAGEAGAGATVTVTGGTIATALGLTADTAVTAAGADAQTYTQALNAASGKTRNWVTVTTVTEETTDNAKLIGAWVTDAFNAGDQFLYVYWTTAAAVKAAGDTSSAVAALREAAYEGVTAVYGDIRYAAFVMGAAGSIAWDMPNSTITFAFKAQAGLEANVLDQTDADNLTANSVNFMGYYATRNDDFILFQTGQMLGQFGWIDTYLNATWLNSALQTQILAGMTAAKKVPYTDAGYAKLRSWVHDVASRARDNGVIDTGVNLSETQKNEIQTETGGIDISAELYNSGYYLQIVDAPATVRQRRESPACNFWYTYGGSIHRVVLPSTAVV